MMELTSNPTLIWFNANLAQIHVDGDQTSGAFDLVEMTMPAGDMPPLHIHHRDDETFYVLEGELSLHVGDDHHVVAAGQALLAPRGVAHTYRAETDTRALVLGSPAGFERFLRSAGTLA